MAAGVPGVDEQAALEDLLNSGFLDRSQNLQKLLVYICRRYFDGRTEDLKEYTIATEALGRPPGFDQKKDSIVRVEIHRLRKRLAQYYSEEGREKPVAIVIPEGKYVPQFVVRPNALPDPTASENLPASAIAVADVPPSPSRSYVGWLVGFAAILVAAAGFLLWRRPAQAPEQPPQVARAVSFPVAGDLPGELRILAGRTAGFVDDRGQKWNADQFFTGGTFNTNAHPPIEGTAQQEIFAAQREGDFQYDLPLAEGTYELRLYFAEILVGEGNPAGGAESGRLFNVQMNGQPLLELFDVLADAPGPRVADVRVFRDVRPTADGKLHLAFRSGTGAAFVNAIELRRTPPGRIRPIRVVTQSRPVTDPLGREWIPDDFVRGGNLVKRNRPVVSSETPELYRSERFGVFSYSLPVAANGIYRVSLYMHEAWFGPENTGKGGVGSRIFDVHINHQPVLVDFDLFKTAGPLRAYVKTVTGVRANPRGKLVIDFEPSRNYACLNAIEVDDITPVAR